MKTYWVYMVLCRDGSYYIGVTNNADRRIAEHNAGIDVHCYTYRRRPVQLVYAGSFNRIEDAIRWEKQIKGWTREKKRALAEGDWERVKALSKRGRVVRHSSFDTRI